MKKYADLFFKIESEKLSDFLESVLTLDKDTKIVTYRTPNDSYNSNLSETKEFIKRGGYALNIFTTDIGQITFHKKIDDSGNVIYAGLLAHPANKDSLKNECEKYSSYNNS